MKTALARAVLLLGVSCNACQSGGGGHPSAPPGMTVGKLTVTSRSFAEGGAIPVDMTCDGANRSPQLTWSAPPAGTQAFAVIVDDPDAPGGDFTHWVVFNLPGDALALPEAADVSQLGASVGLNGFNQAAYGGPCPPEARDPPLRLPRSRPQREAQRPARRPPRSRGSLHERPRARRGNGRRRVFALALRLPPAAPRAALPSRRGVSTSRR